MSTLELKNMLIQRISEINDKSFLEAIFSLLESKSNDKVYALSPKQKDTIIASKSQVANGEIFSNNQISDAFNKWLEEK